MRDYQEATSPALLSSSSASLSDNESCSQADEKCGVEARTNDRDVDGRRLCTGCHDERVDVAGKQRVKEEMVVAAAMAAVVPNMPEHLRRFVVARPDEPAYMRCDKCEFLCRPFAQLFEKHYLAHNADSVVHEHGVAMAVAAATSSAAKENASHSDDVGHLLCDVCDKVFLRKGSLIAHLRRHDQLTCRKCFVTFRTAALLRSHKKRHVLRKSTNNTLIYCEVCKKYFKTKKGYTYHRRKICVQHKCYVCNETFLAQSVLEEHLRRVHDLNKKPPPWSDDVKFFMTGSDDGNGGDGSCDNDDNEDKVKAAARDNETLMSVCPMCGKVVTHAVLPRHMVLHNEERPFTCGLCGKRFKRKNSLQDHIMIEMGMKNYVCDVCGMKFLKQGYLNKHLRYHKLNNGEFQGFQCEVCGKRFPEKWRLGVHQRAVHKGGEFASCRCDICDKKFAERWMVRKHKHMEHNGEEFKEYVCDVCGKRFQEKWMIKSHQRSTHRGGVLKQYCDLCGRTDHTPNDCEHRHALQQAHCVLCGESFSSTYFLKEHVNSTHSFNEAKPAMSVAAAVSATAGSTITAEDDSGDGEYVKLSSVDGRPLEPKNNVLYICAGCGRHFASKTDFKAHEVESKCVAEAKYECTECGKMYTSKFSLSNHLMMHKKASTLVPFKCEMCDKDFFTHEALGKHQSLQKICLLCDKVYPCNDHLKTHVLGEHKEDEEVVEDITTGASNVNEPPIGAGANANKPFECKLCRKKFTRKQAMKNHLFAEMNLRRYVCEFCDKSYNYYSHLKEHIVTNHGEKEFVCGYCGKDFPTKKRFRDHVTLHSEEKPFICTCGLSFKLSRYLNKHKKHCKISTNDH